MTTQVDKYTLGKRDVTKPAGRKWCGSSSLVGAAVRAAVAHVLHPAAVAVVAVAAAVRVLMVSMALTARCNRKLFGCSGSVGWRGRSA